MSVYMKGTERISIQILYLPLQNLSPFFVGEVLIANGVQGSLPKGLPRSGSSVVTWQISQRTSYWSLSFKGVSWTEKLIPFGFSDSQLFIVLFTSKQKRTKSF